MLVAIPDVISESAVEDSKAMERIGESERVFPMIQSTSKRWAGL